MISFECPSCGKSLKAPDEGAGREGRCKCGATFMIPRIGETAEPIDCDDDIPIRRRKKTHMPPALVIGGVFTLGAVTVLVWLGIMNWSTNGSVPSLHSNRTVGDVIQYFRESGLEGVFRPTAAAFIGAKEGGRYSGPGFECEVYFFENQSQAESLEKSGISGDQVFRNGKLVMRVDHGEDKLVPLFRRF